VERPPAGTISSGGRAVLAAARADRERGPGTEPAKSDRGEANGQFMAEFRVIFT